MEASCKLGKQVENPCSSWPPGTPCFQLCGTSLTYTCSGFYAGFTNQTYWLNNIGHLQWAYSSVPLVFSEVGGRAESLNPLILPWCCQLSSAFLRIFHFIFILYLIMGKWDHGIADREALLYIWGCLKKPVSRNKRILFWSNKFEILHIFIS